MTIKPGLLAGVMAAREETTEGAASSSQPSSSEVSSASNSCTTERGRDSIRNIMLERLSVTNAHFAHRQRDEPDLTQQEKFDIAADILEKSPATFLARCV
jgi:hypothetical protein